METVEIFKTEKLVYTSKQSAKDAVKFITDKAGIKCIECDTPKDYITFINLDKTVLIQPGVELYAIWIKNTYKNDKLVYKISLQTKESFGMRIAQFITEKLHADTLILSEEMEDKMENVYRVNQIRSKRATERENLEVGTVEKVIGDFETLEEAKEVYSQTATGMEVDKEIINLETGEVIETTY